MTTLAEMTLKVAREITEVLESTATASAATSITDTVWLTQQAQYWDRGTVWIRSGTYDGQVAVITGFSNNKITFPAFAGDVGSCLYSVARNLFPYHVLVQAVNTALGDIRVKSEETSLAGDGSTLEFSRPAGVSDVESVEFTAYGSSPAEKTPGHHWKIRGGKIKFDYGYAPYNGDTIHLWYKTYHDVLSTYSDTIHADVNEEWLKWEACKRALYWGIRKYEDAKEYRLEELMNQAMSKQKGLLAVPVSFRFHSAGGV